MLVEELDQLGEVGERAGQPVDLVDDDDVNPSSANVVQQPRQAGLSIDPPEKPPSS